VAIQELAQTIMTNAAAKALESDSEQEEAEETLL